MTKMTFTSESDGPNGTTTCTVTTTAVTLPAILQDIELFLRGSGFYFDGSVDIIDDVDVDLASDLDPIARSFGEREGVK